MVVSIASHLRVQRATGRRSAPVAVSDYRVDWNLAGVRPLGPDVARFFGIKQRKPGQREPGERRGLGVRGNLNDIEVGVAMSKSQDLREPVPDPTRRRCSPPMARPDDTSPGTSERPINPIISLYSRDRGRVVRRTGETPVDRGESSDRRLSSHDRGWLNRGRSLRRRRSSASG